MSSNSRFTQPTNNPTPKCLEQGTYLTVYEHIYIKFSLFYLNTAEFAYPESSFQFPPTVLRYHRHRLILVRSRHHRLILQSSLFQIHGRYVVRLMELVYPICVGFLDLQPEQTITVNHGSSVRKYSLDCGNITGFEVLEK